MTKVRHACYDVMAQTLSDPLVEPISIPCSVHSNCNFRRTGAAVTCIQFSPDGSKVLTGGHDSTCREFGLLSSRMLKEFRGHTSYVNCCSYIVLPQSVLGFRGDPDGNNLLAVITGWMTSQQENLSQWLKNTALTKHRYTCYSSTHRAGLSNSRVKHLNEKGLRFALQDTRTRGR